MPRSLRRPLPLAVAVLGLALAGCGGAGYGDPIAATDGDPATVALAPAPVTTAAAAPVAPATTTAPSGGGAAPDDGTTADGGSSTPGTSGAPVDGGTAGSSADAAPSGDGGLAAYASDANRFCTGFTAATRTLTTRIGAAGATNPKALGRAIVSYGAAIDAAAQGLQAAPPPAAVASYHRRTLAWVAGVTSSIDANRSGLLGGNAAAGGRVIGAVQRLGKPPTAPGAVRSRATACAA